MHHRRHAGPPLASRIAGALSRGVRTRPARRRRGGRFVVGTALSTAVTGFVLALPVVSTGPTATPMALDSSATSSTAATRLAEETSPVVMGRDGAAAPSSAEVPPAEVPLTEVPLTDVPLTEVAPETTDATSADAPASSETTATAAETVDGTSAETSAGTPAGTAPSSTRGTAPSASGSTAPSTSPSSAAEASAAAAPAPGPEAQVLTLVNSARAAAGCQPLVADAGLASVARAHSADMRDRDFFDHENPDGLDPFDRAEAAGRTDARAENIAYGQPTAAAVMDDWMDSRGHRANILNCELRTIGVGVADGDGGPWWTQLFGA